MRKHIHNTDRESIVTFLSLSSDRKISSDNREKGNKDDMMNFYAMLE